MGLVSHIFGNLIVRLWMDKNLHEALQEIEQLKEKLKAERRVLEEEIRLEHSFDKIIGNSVALKYVLYRVEQVAPLPTTVLILGETGTGKELIARAIHERSPRKDRPFIKVNCATLPANLIESELFGYEKHAFTGASARKIGRFEVADGSTLFLDEIGELPLELQAKLLRVLQEGTFERLGSNKTIKVDVRIIAATNRDLEAEVAKGRFRQDLWYRLNVFPITMPPLRNRKEDIPLLVSFFVRQFSRKFGKKIRRIPTKVMEALQNYDWPGNIRELENVIERAVIISEGDSLELMDDLNIPLHKKDSIKTLNEVEREYIIKILEKTGWKIEGKDGAASILGLNPSTLRGRMRKLGIKRPR